MPADDRVYAFAFQRPDGKTGAVNDDDGRLILTAYEVLAIAFAVVLQRRANYPIRWRIVGTDDVEKAIRSAHVAIDDISPFVRYIENSTHLTDVEDALWSAIDAANAVPLGRIESPGDSIAMKEHA
jgi:hypothetical protein